MNLSILDRGPNVIPPKAFDNALNSGRIAQSSVHDYCVSSRLTL